MKTFPGGVQDELAFELYQVQIGQTPASRSRFTGPLRVVLEIIESEPNGTYRVMFTVKIGDVVYVLHAFQKKSRRGIATPKSEVDLVAQRLRKARLDHDERADRRG